MRIDYGKLMADISENIRALIAKSGYCTAAEFCRAYGLHESNITRFAAGTRVPTIKSLVEIANATGVSLAELMGPEAF